MARKAPTGSGQKVNELIIKNKLSPEVATRQVLGDIGNNYSLPQGATIISSGLNDLIYKDAQGYTHRIQREGDANSPNFGQIKELQTDRPAVLPLTEQIPGLSGALQAAIQAVQSGLSGNALKPLSATDEASLSAIDQNERNLIKQQSDIAQGELVTDLYGSGTNRSTIANSAAGNFAQALAIALGNQQANAATRRLDVQKFGTQQSNDLGLNLINSITGQETNRADTSGQLDLSHQQLGEQANEAARNFMLEWQKYQDAKNKSKLGSILSGVASLGASILGGPLGGALASGLTGLFGGGINNKRTDITGG